MINRQDNTYKIKYFFLLKTQLQGKKKKIESNHQKNNNIKNINIEKR